MWLRSNTQVHWQMSILIALDAGRKSWRRLACSLALAFGLTGGGSAVADQLPIPPQTKIRVTVVHWVASREEYQKWDALGGDFEVLDDGTVMLPLLGPVPVGNKGPSGLASDIAARLQDKIGLVQAPATTVSILDYPPIYVVGDVKTPGEYRFRDGLTVLQSLAMAGGETRIEDSEAREQAEFAGLLRELDNAILRSRIRIIRLKAEASGEKTLVLEAALSQTNPLAGNIFKQEEAIFLARANLRERQSKAYSDLRELLAGEIRNLEEKAKAAEADIASVEEELRKLKPLLDKRIALPAQKGELERRLRSYYSGRLDLSTAIMRARQGISEAERNLEGLQDKHRSDAASDLQSEQAKLDQLRMKRETTQAQLVSVLAHGDDEQAGNKRMELRFSINRRLNGTMHELAAAESTILLPGDVVRVRKTFVPKLAEEQGVANVGFNQ